MNLFNHRTKSAYLAPAEDGSDPNSLAARLQATLQRTYIINDVSPELRQRIADMAVFHEQQVVMRKLKRSRLPFVLACSSAAGMLWLVYLLFSFYTIPSASMEPTLIGHDAGQLTGEYLPQIEETTIHDCVLVNKWIYRLSNPQFGDIVVFRAPREADAEHRFSGSQVENILVKRIIGLPGDTIEFDGEHIFRNGRALVEPYLKEPMNRNRNYQFYWHGGPLEIGPHQYWVMGDNRNDSNDSRYWGTLERDRILGKVSFIVAPLDRIGQLP